MVNLDDGVVAGVLLLEHPSQALFDLLVGQLNVIGDHHIKDEIGVQRAGGDAEVMDGEGGADLGGQLLSKRPQPPDCPPGWGPYG